MVLFSGIYLSLINEPSEKVHFYFHQKLIFKILQNALQHINVCTIRVVSAAVGGKWRSPVWLHKSSDNTMLHKPIIDSSLSCNLDLLNIYLQISISWFVLKITGFGKIENACPCNHGSNVSIVHINSTNWCITLLYVHSTVLYTRLSVEMMTTVLRSKEILHCYNNNFRNFCEIYIAH